MSEAAESHLARYREIATVLAEEGLGALAVRMHVPEAFHLRRKQLPDVSTPERVRRAMERLGPTWVKLGQMLSTRVDLVPESYRVEFGRLQDSVAPVSYEQVAEVIASELGAPPQLIFAQFSRDPVASASIGQVHAALLPSGHEVVIKVQRPGIVAHVEADLDILVTQARRIHSAGLAPKGIDTVGVAEQFARAIRAELDYLLEAENVDRFVAAFGASDQIVVPRVFHDYTTRRVLTLERLEGVPFNRPVLLDELGFNRHDLATRGVQAYLQQIFELGLFHADPHPGNLFALADGRIGFTDFGRVGTVPRGIRDAAADILLAVVDRDSDLAADALLSVSSDPGGIDFERLRREISVLIGKYHGTELGSLGAGELIEDLLDLTRRERLCLPSEFALMMGTLAVLEGVGRQLDPEFDFVEVARPFSDRLMRAQLRPDRIAGVALRSLRRMIRAGMEIPASTERALRRVAEGEFHIGVRPEGYQALLDRIEELADRVAFALLVAAFVIGFSTMLTVRWLPRWLDYAILVGMLMAIGVSTWMFVSLMTARIRGRRGGA